MKRFISFTRLTAICLGLCALALFTSTAQAANGDNVSTIIADRTGTACVSVTPGGDHGGVGVGIAFNGTNLLISCYNDSTVVEINPADGSQVAVHFIAGATSLGALAWDGTASQLWGCSSFGTVGIIDLTLDTFTAVFPTFVAGGCFDGLAYDGGGTLWASGDVYPTTEHYMLDGTLIAQFPSLALMGGTGGSGIAAGTTGLFLANNGASQIWFAQKDFTSSVLFAAFPRRLEDLECDPITFADAGIGAIWSTDAYDNILNAYEVSAEECPFGGGGGLVACTQGYWKNHPDSWANLDPDGVPAWGGGLTYMQILWTQPSKGDASVILAHAYISARLNTGADVGDLADAAAMLAAHPVGSGDLKSGKNAHPDRAVALAIAANLQAFNEQEQCEW